MFNFIITTHRRRKKVYFFIISGIHSVADHTTEFGRSSVSADITPFCLTESCYHKTVKTFRRHVVLLKNTTMACPFFAADEITPKTTMDFLQEIVICELRSYILICDGKLQYVVVAFYSYTSYLVTILYKWKCKGQAFLCGQPNL